MIVPTADLEHLRTWIGRTEVRADVITAAPVAALAATLDRDDPYPEPGTELPVLWHWLYFSPVCRQSELGSDGHPARGGFMPLVPFARRMWARGRIHFQRPLRVGDAVTRRSEITDIAAKTGRVDSVVFVTVAHEIFSGATLALTEEQDIAYVSRAEAGSAKSAPQMAPTNEDFALEVRADPVLLFRYSALTFNGHRIHYDRRYAMDVEGYRGLVVHGPLTATMLLECLRKRSPQRIRNFSFKAVKPLFEGDSFTLCGRRKPDRTVDLWARDPSGGLAMHASVEFA